jgi:hypothetical protein
MRRLVCFVVSCLFATATLAAQQAAPQLAFESVPDFFKLPPGMNFGEVSGVAVNSKGHVGETSNWRAQKILLKK